LRNIWQVRAATIGGNVEAITSKGLRDMSNQVMTDFERATMLQLPLKPLLVIACVSHRILLIINLKQNIK
jgi:hypothetical protein